VVLDQHRRSDDVVGGVAEVAAEIRTARERAGIVGRDGGRFALRAVIRICGLSGAEVSGVREPADIAAGGLQLRNRKAARTEAVQLDGQRTSGRRRRAAGRDVLGVDNSTGSGVALIARDAGRSGRPGRAGRPARAVLAVQAGRSRRPAGPDGSTRSGWSARPTWALGLALLARRHRERLRAPARVQHLRGRVTGTSKGDEQRDDRDPHRWRWSEPACPTSHDGPLSVVAPGPQRPRAHEL
jgi:hypothetical protein